jgi:hypothetical protein
MPLSNTDKLLTEPVEVMVSPTMATAYTDGLNKLATTAAIAVLRK